MKTLIFIFALTLSPSLYAQSCWSLVDIEAARINKEDGYKKNVGGQFYMLNGQIGYWPGFEVAADIDNWAEDFSYAIKYGPLVMSYSNDPREDILKMFRKEIKDDCDLPKDKHDKLRAMLKELMEDGSFCPEQKLLERPFIGRWKHYKKVLSKAVKEGRFQEECVSKAVVSEQDRTIKDVVSPSGANGGAKGGGGASDQ